MRLKLHAQTVLPSPKPGFQYQKGAIKTPETLDRSTNRMPFNTKKVRLKLLGRRTAPIRTETFNTKKVRLKPSYTAQETPPVFTFNTKKVRLKPGWPPSWSRPTTFQYQKGAIKTAGAKVWRAFRSAAFQYQKGAIKTAAPNRRRVKAKCFQYQKGAIKTKCGKMARAKGIKTFNTKKVRLKLKEQITFRFDDETFNTKKVRLKPWSALPQTDAISSSFQYQKGAIKTRVGRAKLRFDLAFNTKKVRLKLNPSSERSRSETLSFQYQKGAIKTGLRPRPRALCRAAFQYQKGAIKT